MQIKMQIRAKNANRRKSANNANKTQKMQKSAFAFFGQPYL